jgi:chorismate mutase
VNCDNKFTVNGSLGTSDECTWKPWSYTDRLQIATKVATKKQELDQTALADSTKRSKVLNYIRSLNSRQEHVPVLGHLVEHIFAEPLHNTNNAWQQLHGGYASSCH